MVRSCAETESPRPIPWAQPRLAPIPKQELAALASLVRVEPEALSSRYERNCYRADAQDGENVACE